MIFCREGAKAMIKVFYKKMIFDLLQTFKPLKNVVSQLLRGKKNEPLKKLEP